MSLPPVEIPLGAMRFNFDSQKLEYFNGEIWMQIHTFSPNLDGGGRGVFGGGYGSAPHANMGRIDYITISTAGNSVDFGDMSTARSAKTGGASNARGLFIGGRFSPTSDGYNIIDYIPFSSTGNAINFGDLLERNPGMHGLANQTRSLFAGGYTQPSQTYVNTIEYVTIASTGNAKDFGDIPLSSNQRNFNNAGSSPTRGIWGGGRNNPTWFSEIYYKEIASLGNAEEFGDLTLDKANSSNSMTSSTRMVFTGGTIGPTPGTTVMDYIEFATKGNAVKFGDQSFGNQACCSVSSPVRGVLYTGSDDSAQTNTLEYITIATQGDAIDFGDLGTLNRHYGAFSNAHGGLG